MKNRKDEIQKELKKLKSQFDKIMKKSRMTDNDEGKICDIQQASERLEDELAALEE